MSLSVPPQALLIPISALLCNFDSFLFFWFVCLFIFFFTPCQQEKQKTLICWRLSLEFRGSNVPSAKVVARLFPLRGVFRRALRYGPRFSIQVEKREGDVRSRLKDGIQKADVTIHPPLNPLPSIILSLCCPLGHCFHADALANTIPLSSRNDARER